MAYDSTDNRNISRDFSDDPVFLEEQAHLDDTYAKLQRKEAALMADLEAISQNAAADMAAMRAELGINFGEADHALETLADYELMNHVIDSYNAASDINREELARIAMLLKRPYFAKVTLQFQTNRPPRDVYLGVAGMADENQRHFIVDWRSPVAEVYYNQENGPTSYEANGRVINVDLLLRRQFDITGNVLNSYFDTTVAIQDQLLLDSLAKRRTDKLQAITTTIQKEQNQVIRHADVPALLVDGIAGSGKTSVLLQRIAYLLYTYRETLDPGDVYLMSPNPVFGRYIDNVLPQMGEKNPHILTYDDLVAEIGRPDRGSDRQATMEDLARIDAAITDLRIEPADYCDIKIENETVVPASQIISIAKQYSHVPVGSRFFALIAEELLDRLESKVSGLVKSERIHGQIADLTLDEQLHYFSRPVYPQTEEDFQELAEVYLEKRYAPAFAQIESIDWIRVDRVGMRILDHSHLSRSEWIYLKLALTGQANTSARFVMIDEVQGYSEVQLATMARYFRNAHFLLLGDPNQALEEDAATFQQIEDLFTAEKGSCDTCHLMTSYRSSPEITKLFSRMMPPETRMLADSVQRPGTQPVIKECMGDGAADAHLSALREIIANMSASPEEQGLTAIICANSHSARRLYAQLTEDLSVQELNKLPQINLIEEGDSLPASGIVLLGLKLARGLEFDRVILADASAKVFPNTDLSRRRLYTAISRATQEIIILSCGDMTALLQ